MLSKEIDLNKSVYELCNEYPEVADILREIGFADIAKPGMINTVGRFMTIPKGAGVKGIDIGDIKKTFEAKGFTILV